MKKRFLAFLLTFTVILAFVSVAFSHETSQFGVINFGESIGWDILESNHTNGRVLYYVFNGIDSCTMTDTERSNFISYLAAGAAKWNATGYADIRNADDYTNLNYSAISIGNIAAFNNPDSDVNGYCEPLTILADGHYGGWRIRLNISSRHLGGFTPDECSMIAAHELGHAFGLMDLYSKSADCDNRNKLMFGVFNKEEPDNSCSVRNPTSSDIKGLRVITGQHGQAASPHVFTYRNLNADVHLKTCIICDGYAFESHNNTGCTTPCSICGYVPGHD